MGEWIIDVPLSACSVNRKWMDDPSRCRDCEEGGSDEGDTIGPIGTRGLEVSIFKCGT